MPASWRERFGWSYSRQLVWDRCRREFYYEAIAPWEDRPAGAQREELWWLRKLTPKGALVGWLVHDAIEAHLDAHLGTGLGDARSAFLTRLREFEAHPEKRLVEVVNGADLEAGWFEEVRERGLAHLDRFLEDVWPRYAHREVLEHEAFDHLEVGGHRVNLRVDLLTRDRPDGDGDAGGRVRVTDWKTGKPRESLEDDLQMSTYLLWAVRSRDLAPHEVVAETVNLAHGERLETTRTAEELEAVEASIVEAADAMLAVRSMDDVPPEPADWKCPGCRFQTVCPAGRDLLEGSHRNLFRR